MRELQRNATWQLLSRNFAEILQNYNYYYYSDTGSYFPFV